MSCLHRVPEIPPETTAPCQMLPQCARSKVQIFLINGCDPLGCANLDGVAHYLNSIGFTQTHVGGLFHGGIIRRKIEAQHEQCPDHRYVLIGFDHGAGLAQDIARKVAGQGIPVSLVVYLNGKGMDEIAPDLLPVGRQLNFYSDPWLCSPALLENADNTGLADAGYFGLPTHPLVLQQLTEELAAVAGTVPVVVPAARPFPEKTEPMPPGGAAPAMPHLTRQRQDAWDFLLLNDSLVAAPAGTPLTLPAEPTEPITRDETQLADERPLVAPSAGFLSRVPVGMPVYRIKPTKRPISP